jgi:hypothetical protein
LEVYYTSSKNDKFSDSTDEENYNFFIKEDSCDNREGISRMMHGLMLRFLKAIGGYLGLTNTRLES